MTVSGEEFVRLFTLHLLPPRLHRVRYCGIFAQRKRRQLLKVASSFNGKPQATALEYAEFSC